MSSNKMSIKMRIIHRYLGFFLMGIMTMYGISGISLIFRNTDAFKVTQSYDKTITQNLDAENLGKTLKIRNLKITKEEADMLHFKEGTYNKSTGEAIYSIKKLPKALDKIQHLHKATTNDPLFYLNIFFGLSLMFFVVSSLWMFTPSSSIFKKGMLFTLGGIALYILMLVIG